MALHGNKSQAARTQALDGFKSGEVRALVATDIAARGIDIDDLPHVVNYEIPNISEDYVHRIGRTGRAGASGEAISFVCMDEEGFMQDVERFINQRIEVKLLEGFGPEPGEKAEPLAMGRQVLWGGLGKPPSREVMANAAKTARQEMMTRIREKKATQPPRRNPKPAGQGPAADGQGGIAAERADGGSRNKRRRRGGGSGAGYAGGQPPQGFAPRGDRRPEGQFGDAPRRAPQGNRDGARDGAGAGGRQPDPLRTSIDAMSERGRGNGGNRRGGNGGGGRSHSAGNSRGPADPLRTSFGRIK